MSLRPQRGGFLRPFGTAIFIRDFLASDGAKYGATSVDMVVQEAHPATDLGVKAEHLKADIRELAFLRGRGIMMAAPGTRW